jgi:hypothetical protein
MLFLKTSTNLHTKIAAETNLADREMVRVKGTWKVILKLLVRTPIPVANIDVG